MAGMDPRISLAPHMWDGQHELRWSIERIADEALDRAGVELDDGPVTVDKFTVIEVHEGQSLVRITLHEGRNRVVRRMMDEVGFPVVKLVRTHVGSVALGEQRPGSLRVLGNDEVGGLYKAVGL